MNQESKLLLLAIGVGLVGTGAALAFPSNVVVGVVLLAVGGSLCAALGIMWLRAVLPRRNG